jgi:hypothetical protein
MLNCAIADDAEVLDGAVKWLVAQQDESGAFKSRRYGAMKQGAAMTSLALYALSGTSGETRKENRESIERAFEFLMPGTKARGRVANPDGSLDHPVYSTAMFLVAAHRFEKELDSELVNTLIKYLVDAQCAEGRGFTSDNPNYGGWDVIGPDVMPGKTSGTNVSVTYFVLEAIDCWLADETLTEETRAFVDRKKVRDWLVRLHKRSGGKGFLFTAQPGSALNKSKTAQGQPRAYSTATCDAWSSLCLLREDDWHSDGFNSLEQWLKLNVKASTIFGFEVGDQSGWPAALHFYHLQGLSRVAKPFTQESSEDEWAAQTCRDISKLLKEAQKQDGRFENESALMRENDPLIATSFAIIALSHLLK